MCVLMSLCYYKYIFYGDRTSGRRALSGSSAAGRVFHSRIVASKQNDELPVNPIWPSDGCCTHPRCLVCYVARSGNFFDSKFCFGTGTLPGCHNAVEEPLDCCASHANACALPLLVRTRSSKTPDIRAAPRDAAASR